jgi:hypothetical protein
MVNFWNGNKSPARQAYEWDVLKLALSSQGIDVSTLHNDLTDYPKAEDEGNVFNHGTDALVTVAGNTKFNQQDFYSPNIALCMGLLGFRVLIIRKQDQEKFANSTELDLKALKAGIPATWADANLFRSNQYSVYEKGTLDSIFEDLQLGLCDYVALGANEVQSIYEQFAAHIDGLVIEKKRVLYYPFPLVMYVHAAKKELCQTIEAGLEQIVANGELKQLFDQHYGAVVAAVELSKREKIELNNPELPLAFSDFNPGLI